MLLLLLSLPLLLRGQQLPAALQHQLAQLLHQGGFQHVVDVVVADGGLTLALRHHEGDVPVSGRVDVELEGGAGQDVGGANDSSEKIHSMWQEDKIVDYNSLLTCGLINHDRDPIVTADDIIKFVLTPSRKCPDSELLVLTAAVELLPHSRGRKSVVWD